MAVQLRMRVDTSSFGQLEQALTGIKDGVKNRVVKQAIGKVARRAAKAEKQMAPRGPSGTLKKSIGTKYKSYRRGQVWVYIIGPRSGVSGTAPHQPKRRYKFVPTRYAHLAERGRGPLQAKRYPNMLFYPTPKAAYRLAKPTVGPARGFRFAERTWKMLDSPSARLRRQIAEDVEAGIGREIAKYSAKGKTIYT